MTGRARASAAAIVAGLSLTLAACGGNSPTSATRDTKKLEVVSWWTSGSEAAALETLFAAFRESNKGVEAVNGAVAGGAGSNAIVALAKRLQDGDPPDVWQTFAGKSVQGYASRGVVRSVASVFDGEDLRARMNPTILRSRPARRPAVRRPDRRASQQRSVVQPEAARQAGVTPPSSGYTLAAFLADLQKVKASGAVALCLGGKDRFTTVELFENTLLSSIGTGGWKDMVDDNLDWRSGRVQTALKRFGAMLGYSRPAGEPAHLGPGDEEARVGRLRVRIDERLRLRRARRRRRARGRGLRSDGLPRHRRELPRRRRRLRRRDEGENAKNALAFLGDISQPATQLAFNKAKGSIPVLRDVDVASLTAYQRTSSKALWTKPVLLSIAHGEAMSPEFQEGFYDAVSTYIRTRSTDAFADDLEDAVSKDRIPQR